MTFGLSDKSYRELMSILASVPEIDEAVLYGSRARGDYGHASDIDLSLKGPQLTRRHLSILNQRLYESHIPYFFDTNIYSSINNADFKANIDRDGRVIYARR